MNHGKLVCWCACVLETISEFVTSKFLECSSKHYNRCAGKVKMIELRQILVFKGSYCVPGLNSIFHRRTLDFAAIWYGFNCFLILLRNVVDIRLVPDCLVLFVRGIEHQKDVMFAANVGFSSKLGV